MYGLEDKDSERKNAIIIIIIFLYFIFIDVNFRKTIEVAYDYMAYYLKFLYYEYYNMLKQDFCLSSLLCYKKIAKPR